MGFIIINGKYLFLTLKKPVETEGVFLRGAEEYIFIMADFASLREVLGIFARVFSQHTGPDA